MSLKRFLPILAAGCLLGPAAWAQTIPVAVKSQPEAPVRITGAACSSAEGKGEQCTATLAISSDGSWTAYGLKWTFRYSDGRTLSAWSLADSSIRPDGDVGTLAPGSTQESSAGGGFGVRGVDGRDVSLSGAEVEVEFVVSAEPGKNWGNTRSVFFHRLMAFREGYAQARRHLRAVPSKSGRDGAPTP